MLRAARSRRPDDPRPEVLPAAHEPRPSVAALLSLQRTAGNHAVGRMLSRRVAEPVALDGDSTMAALIDAVTDELLRTGKAERALGRKYVRMEVRALLLGDNALDATVLRDVAAAEAHTLAEICAPVAVEIRRRRDARHLRWLRRAKRDFDARIKAEDPRGLTLRSHEDLTRTKADHTASRHYRALDAELGGLDETMKGQEILWRFTSKPAQEQIVVGRGVNFDRLNEKIAQHTGGNRKDDARVRTLSFGRNLGALIGVAYSKGGDANVAGIATKAEYLYGVPIASLAGQGITAHPAESRLIGVFETEYVLVGTPGDPARRLEDLATYKYRNPFKRDTPLLEGKVPTTTGAPVADPPSPELTDAPEGFSDAVLAEAKRIQAAATKQTALVQMKDDVQGAKMFEAAMRILHADLHYAAVAPCEIRPRRAPDTTVRGGLGTKPPG